MRSRGARLRFYDSADFAAVTQAFDAAWAVLRAHETDDDNERKRHLGILLSQTLAALAAEGVTDAEQLRNSALQRMPLTLASDLWKEGDYAARVNRL